VFILDTTGSQDEYIRATTASCKDISFALQSSGQLESDGLRLGVVAFRDHLDEYVTKEFGGFTTNVKDVASNLKSLEAKGGGDGPEAITAALDAALRLKWRSDAVKVAVLITDAPPHGIGEQGDDYWDGDPQGKDPLKIARAMARKGISLVCGPG